MKILIAYDGTPGARAVFSDMERAALPPGVEAHVVSVATAGRLPSARALLVDEARLLAEAGAAHVRAAFPEWTVSADVVEGAPAASIVDAARRLGVELVFVGTRGLKDAERAALGSVAREVITNTRCSVRVCRRSPGPHTSPRRLLIGFDGSAGADDAVAEVCRRPWPAGTEARLLAALPPAGGAGTEPSGVQSRSEPAAGKIDATLAVVTARLSAAGLTASAAVRPGEARRALLDEAEAWAPDVIFLGGRRLQRLRRFLFGSVAGEVADDAPCTVEVVRHLEV